MIQPQQPSEKDQRIDSINSALNTITNLQTQLNGISSQLSMILGNLGQLAGGLQDNIQFLVKDGIDSVEKIKLLEIKVKALTPEIEEEKTKKIKTPSKKTDK